MKYAVVSSAVILIYLVFCVNSSIGATITVDCASGGDYLRIMDGINAAADGDTVLVSPCVYSGSGNWNMDLQGKNLVIMSSDGPEVTIIDLLNQEPAFFFAFGEGPSTVLDGFTIRNGYTAGSGGAISMWNNSSPTISNCIIEDSGAGFSGGAIALDESSSPTITNCTITGNTAGYNGGGIWADFAAPTITNCTITNNVADSSGGGIYAGNGSPDINNCTIDGNTADDGGGIFVGSYSGTGSGPSISNCSFTGNTAVGSNLGGYGGGLCYEDIEPQYSYSFIWACRFENNTANADGGGICGRQSTVSIYNCLFNGNSALDNPPYSGDGGGIYLYDCVDPLITNCTLVYNNADYRGAGIFFGLSDATITNCIFFWNDGSLGDDYYSFSSNPTITYSGFSVYVAGTGNLDIEDPQFAEEIDFHLDSGSPCVDTGDPAILDGSQPPGLGGTRSDMGTYGGSDNGDWLEGVYDLFLYPTGPTTVNVGDTVFFDALFWNSTNNPAPGDYWLSAVLPNSMEILIPEFVLSLPNPLHGSTPAHSSVTLPNQLQALFPGTFEVVARIGVYPNVVVDEESFEVVITP